MLVNSRGDTIIEVLLAVTIFSLVAIGAMTIMNQGTNSAQRALEITLVRQQIDAQAESLRAAHQAFTSIENPVNTSWQKIIDDGTSTATAPAGSCPTTAPGGSFVMDARDASVVQTGSWFKSMSATGALPHAQVIYSGISPESYGIWIERQKGNAVPANTPEYYNFTINACWFGAGMGTDTPMEIKTLVRLYDPS